MSTPRKIQVDVLDKCLSRFSATDNAEVGDNLADELVNFYTAPGDEQELGPPNHENDDAEAAHELEEPPPKKKLTINGRLETLKSVCVAGIVTPDTRTTYLRFVVT